MRPPFHPGLRWHLLHGLYQAAWVLALPALLALLWLRGRREAAYRAHWGERFGRVAPRSDRPVWVHAASLGEVRGIAPLVERLRQDGASVLFTTLTPAGRSAVERLFAPAPGKGAVQVVYAPIDVGWAVRRFLHRVRPRCALMVENDSWPTLLAQTRKAGIALAMVNAQYAQKNVLRDARWWGFRARMFQAYELVLSKSAVHAQRFRELGCPRVEVAGETRFDQQIAPLHLQAAQRLSPQLRQVQAEASPSTQTCVVIAFVSVVEGEDALFVDAIRTLRRTLSAEAVSLKFVYVPRSPQRFEASASLLAQAGLRVALRSQALDEHLEARGPLAGPGLAECEVLVGDSLGEMHFYLALADIVVVGGSFLPQGAHNVIEPLAQRKPVIVGPVTWTIEYPAVEALQAGVLLQVPDGPTLAATLRQWVRDPASRGEAVAAADRFLAEHAGATERHHSLLQNWMPSLDADALRERPSPACALAMPLRISGVALAALEPLWRLLLRRRLARGRESVSSLAQKLMRSPAARPAGPLVWGHAVGVGEAQALVGLFAALAERLPRHHFLITSSARTSGQVLAAGLPPRCQHQFAPIDSPRIVAKFLQHWQPSLAVWCEMDLWPVLVAQTARRNVPMVLLNARITAASLATRLRFRGFYAAILRCYTRLYAHDAASEQALLKLGAPAQRMGQAANIKALARPLPCEEDELQRWQPLVATRPVWLAASSHEGEEAALLAAHALLREATPAALLIIAPRYPARGVQVASLAAQTHAVALRSRGDALHAGHTVYVADTIGEMGLWYRLAPVAFVGGSLVGVGGHNPFEPLGLGCRVLHGPRVHNFADSYAGLDADGLARPVCTAKEIADAVRQAWAESRAPALSDGPGARRVRQMVDELAAMASAASAASAVTSTSAA